MSVIAGSLVSLLLVGLVVKITLQAVRKLVLEGGGRDPGPPPEGFESWEDFDSFLASEPDPEGEPCYCQGRPNEVRFHRAYGLCPRTPEGTALLDELYPPRPLI